MPSFTVAMDRRPQSPDFRKAYDHRTPVHVAVFGRVRRLLTRGAYRRHLALFTLFLLILFVTFRGSLQASSYVPWQPGVFSCPSNRNNPHGIRPPSLEPHEVASLSRIWLELRNIFDAHSPSPPSLPHPKHGNDPPAKEQLSTFLEISKDEAHATRVEHAKVVGRLAPYPENVFNGRGIVMLAGGRYSEYAATALGMLREVGSRLPVEVWMKDESEEMAGWCAELVKEGMECRKLSDYMDMGAISHPYQMKVFTMLFSSFEEFIFLDADSMPLKNPDVLLDSVEYRKAGAILWPDYWKHTGSPWLPYILGITEDSSDVLADEQSVESGQVVWHKKRHWKSLLLATFYNYLGPTYYYSLLTNGWAGWGDKDTFPMALKALDEPYFQVPHGIITLFVTKDSGPPHGIGMVQADPAEADRVPLFLHSNIVKWGMREFLCLGCVSPGTSQKAVSHLENVDSAIHSHLSQGKRIFGTNELAVHGMDPEPLLWKCMEHTACRTVWGSEQMCSRAREHMAKTFGFTFRKGRFGSDTCVVDPSTVPAHDG